ncbi:UNVERIFIED_CONTAM: hypothetical protein GTU68_032387 [Idotea baltica]|nr:hypothetical protein [Idotea baltica]
MHRIIFIIGLVLLVGACKSSQTAAVDKTEKVENILTKVEKQVLASDSLILDGEKHFENLRQLTFGGENAEAYFSYDNKQLVFQQTNKANGIACDQIYVANIPTSPGEKFTPKLVSTGMGRTTCSYFMKDNAQIIFASTHDFDEDCPAVPDRSVIKKYVWPIYESFELYRRDIETDSLIRMTNNNYYDAEATLSPDGSKIVYTSIKSGDLELYVMNADGSNEIQITSDLGYDGGAFFSPDGKQLVFRASRPNTEAEIKEYKDLLTQNMVAPTNMEIYTVNIDGSNLQQITQLGKANWAPYFHPSGNKIIFSSNHQTERGFPFNLYIINTDGTGLEKITE